MKIVPLVHEEKNPFKCEICDFSCAQRNVLKVHVASVHEGDKPFNCDICKYCFPKRDKVKKTCCFSS